MEFISDLFGSNSALENDLARWPLFPDERPVTVRRIVPLIQKFHDSVAFGLDKIYLSDATGEVSGRAILTGVLKTMNGLKLLGIGHRDCFAITTGMCREAVLLTFALDAVGAEIVFLRPGLSAEDLALRLEKFSCTGMLVRNEDFDPEVLEMTSFLETILFAGSEMMPTETKMGSEVYAPVLRILGFWDVGKLDKSQISLTEEVRLPVYDWFLKRPKFYLLANDALESEAEAYLGFSDFAVLSALKMMKTCGAFSEYKSTGRMVVFREMWTVLGFRDVFLNLCEGCHVHFGEGVNPKDYYTLSSDTLSLPRKRFLEMMERTPEEARLDGFKRVFVSLSRYENQNPLELTAEVKKGRRFLTDHNSWAKASNRLEVPELFGLGTYFQGATEFAGSLGKLMPGVLAEVVDKDGSVLRRQQEGVLILSAPCLVSDVKLIFEEDRRAFYENHLLKKAGRLMVKTGIMVRMDAGGRLYL